MIVLIVFTAFFNLVIYNSYGPLLHSLPLSLADRTLDGHIDSNREQAEHELEAEGSEAGHAEKKPSGSQMGKEHTAAITDGAVVDSPSNETPPSPSIDADRSSSELEAADKKQKSKSESIHSMRGIDEDSGPKEFYHPASVEPQRVVWLPKDTMGLSEVEEAAIKERGIHVSTEAAEMDAKGHVDIQGGPPGGDVRVA